jgi:hypothetical protein
VHVKKTATTWIKNARAFLSPLELRCLNKGIRDNEKPFPVLYVTLKARKLPALPLKSRPIMSANGSLLFGIGIWLDDQLKVVAQLQRSFFKSSADLQKKCTTADVPDNVTLFTADAVSYYTNIPTDKALRKIAKYLRDNTNRDPKVPINATIEALEIIMCNNFFTFGDTTWIHNDGTAMGTPPAPSYATIYYGIHEDTLLAEFEVNPWEYSRFIDDVASGWIAGTDPVYDLIRWTYFKMRMNDNNFEI